MHRIVAAGVTLAACTLAAPAAAVEPVAPEWTIILGAGGLHAPRFEGSSRYRLRPLPVVDIRWRDVAFASFRDGIGVNLVREGGLTAGPLAKFRFARKESDDRRALRGLGRVDHALEVGGFVRYVEGPLLAGLELRQDVAGGHRGAIAEADLRYRQRFADAVSGSVGVSAAATSGRWMRSYFGIDGGQSAASGLPVYRPRAGFKSVGASASLSWRPLDPVALTVTTGYARLVGDAARSPIVRDRGSPNQLSAGLFLSYRLEVPR